MLLLKTKENYNCYMKYNEWILGYDRENIDNNFKNENDKLDAQPSKRSVNFV